MATEERRFPLVAVLDEATILESDLESLRRSAAFLLECLQYPATAGDAWGQHMEPPTEYGTSPGVDLLAAVFRAYDSRVREGTLRIRELAGER